jgi:hypothetical protein
VFDPAGAGAPNAENKLDVISSESMRAKDFVSLYFIYNPTCFRGFCNHLFIIILFDLTVKDFFSAPKFWRVGFSDLKETGKKLIFNKYYRVLPDYFHSFSIKKVCFFIDSYEILSMSNILCY